MTDVLDDLRWLRRVTEDDDCNIYGRAIVEIERLRDAIADRNPTGGDVKQAPSRSDESGGAGTAIAHNLPPYPSTD